MLPRMLIISHNSFSKSANNGKTLETIFGDFPKENIAQLFFSMNESPDFSFCDNYFKITDIDVLRNIISFGGKKYGGTLSIDNDASPLHEASSSLNKTYLKIFKIFKQRSNKLVLFRDLFWKIGRWKIPSLNEWIKGFNPDLIFYVGGNNSFSHEIVLEIHHKFDIPLVTFFTDDYILNPITRNIIDKIQEKRIKKVYRKTIKESSKCFAIGQKMCEAYTEYFNKEFSPIMNSIEVEEYIKPRSKPNKNEKILISYIGGLHLDRWKMICKFSSIISNYTDRILIRVYTATEVSQEINDQFKMHNIDFAGAVYGLNLKKALYNSDILLHVESDNVYYRSLTKLSVSTKIPEYLATGVCVVGYGPGEVASMQLLSENQIGIVVPSDSQENEIIINTQIGTLLDYEKRVKIGEKGYNFAKAYFNSEIVRKEFINKLKDINNVSI